MSSWSAKHGGAVLTATRTAQWMLSTLCHNLLLKRSNSNWSWWGPGALKLEAEKDVWPRPCSYFVIQFLYNPESVSLWDRYNIQVCCEAPEKQSDFHLQRERRCAETPVCILTVIPGKVSSAQERACVGTQMRRERGFPIFQKPEGVQISPGADAESMSHMQLPFFFSFRFLTLLSLSFRAGTDTA